MLLPNTVMSDFGMVFDSYFDIKFLFLGKIMFCFIDCMIGWLLFQISLFSTKEIFEKENNSKLLKCKNNLNNCYSISLLWLFNPFVIVISARGSADSLVCCFVLLTLFLLQKNKVKFY